jgi:transposase
MARILAIDLGKFKSVTCLLDTDTSGTEFWTMSTSRHYLLTVLKHYNPDQVVIESCSIAGWIHDVCAEEGYQVLVCSPNEEAWKWKYVKRKTDRDDALKLAKLAAMDQLVPVHVPCAQQREYRRLVNYRHVVVRRVNRIKNNIRSLFAQHGLSLPRGHQVWSLEGVSQLAERSQSLTECADGALWRGELDMELSQLNHLREQQKEQEKRLRSWASRDWRVQLLGTIPGVGRPTAEVIVAYVDDPHRFKSAAQISSYAGLVPRRYQSGEMDRHGRIHKRGPRLLRTALVEAAWMTLRYNPWARDVYARICSHQKTRRKKAIVAVARKLLVRCWVMLKRREAWRPEASQPAIAC